jgi:hypothetical protein
VSRWAGPVAALVLLASSPVAADHPGLRSGPANPLYEALIWAAGAFLVGLAVVAIVSVLARRRRSPE